ncbi:hypothetical protein ACLB2K_029782 [Fragaria x ananassa]
MSFGPTPVAFLAHEGWRGLAARDEDFIQKILIPHEIRYPRRILISSSHRTLQFLARWDREFTFLAIIGKSDNSPYRRPSLSCLKHKAPQYKPHNSAACRSLAKEEILTRFGNPDHTKSTMANSQPIPEAGHTLSIEEVRRMFEELRSDLKNEIGALRREFGLKVEETQQTVQDLSAQVAKDKEIWLANQENHARLSEEFNYVVGTIREDKDIMTGSLQRIQTELEQRKVAFTKTLEAQTCRLNDHDTQSINQQLSQTDEHSRNLRVFSKPLRSRRTPL